MKEQEKVAVGAVACLVVCGWVMRTWAFVFFLAADGVRCCVSPCVLCCAVLCCAVLCVVGLFVTSSAAGVPVFALTATGGKWLVCDVMGSRG
jgi:hypothetical protein